MIDTQMQVTIELLNKKICSTNGWFQWPNKAIGQVGLNVDLEDLKLYQAQAMDKLVR